jgi:hypothetical protein
MQLISGKWLQACFHPFECHLLGPPSLPLKLQFKFPAQQTVPSHAQWISNAMKQILNFPPKKEGQSAGRRNCHSVSLRSMPHTQRRCRLLPGKTNSIKKNWVAQISSFINQLYSPWYCTVYCIPHKFIDFRIDWANYHPRYISRFYISWCQQKKKKKQLLLHSRWNHIVFSKHKSSQKIMLRQDFSYK